MIDVSESLSVPGFMSEDELEWLAEHAKSCQFIAEIGCWMGRSTTALAKYCPGKVLSVDTWEGSVELKFLLDGLADDDLFSNWVAYTSAYGNVIHCRMESLRAAERLFNDGIVVDGKLLKMPAFDMVFIDGSHDYDNVKADILAWMPCVKDGGLLCGHDFHHPPVKQVVTELFGPEHQRDNPDTRIWAVEVHWKAA